MSYFPILLKYALSIINKPPAIIGDLIGAVWSFFLNALSSLEIYSHLNTRFQSNPPLRSADAKERYSKIRDQRSK